MSLQYMKHGNMFDYVVKGKFPLGVFKYYAI